MKAAFLIEPGKVEFRETSRPELAPGRSTDSTDSSWHLRVRCFLFFGPPRNILSPPPLSRTCGAGSGSGEWCDQIRNWCAGYCGAKLSLWFVPLLSYGTRPYLPEQDKHGGNGARMLCRLCGGACRVRLATAGQYLRLGCRNHRAIGGFSTCTGSIRRPGKGIRWRWLAAVESGYF